MATQVWVLDGLRQDDEFALMQGEKEAEMMIIEAYAALLLAFLSTERWLLSLFLPHSL